jgi:hypothetical protein
MGMALECAYLRHCRHSIQPVSVAFTKWGRLRMPTLSATVVVMWLNTTSGSRILELANSENHGE